MRLATLPLLAALLFAALPKSLAAPEPSIQLRLQRGDAREGAWEQPAIPISDALAVMVDADSVALWETETQRELARTPPLTDQSWKQWVIQVPKMELYGLQRDGRVAVFSLRTLKLLREHAAPGPDMQGVELSPDGRWRLTEAYGELTLDDLTGQTRPITLPERRAAGLAPPVRPSHNGKVVGYALMIEASGAALLSTSDGCLRVPANKKAPCPSALPSQLPGGHGLTYWGAYWGGFRGSTYDDRTWDGVYRDMRTILVSADTQLRQAVTLRVPEGARPLDAWFGDAGLTQLFAEPDGLRVIHPSKTGASAERALPARTEHPFSIVHHVGADAVLLTAATAPNYGHVAQVELSGPVGPPTPMPGPGPTLGPSTGPMVGPSVGPAPSTGSDAMDRLNDMPVGSWRTLWTWESAPEGALRPICEAWRRVPEWGSAGGPWLYASPDGLLADTSRWIDRQQVGMRPPQRRAELVNLTTCEVAWTSPSEGWVVHVYPDRGLVAWVSRDAPEAGPRGAVCLSPLAGGPARCLALQKDSWGATPSPDGQRLVSVVDSGPDVELDVDALQWRPLTGGPAPAAPQWRDEDLRTLRRSADGALWVTTHLSDPATRLFSTRDGALLATLIRFADGSWAALDAEGRFDRAGDTDGLYWVLEIDGGLESIGLDQLARYYYEPGLLGKILSPDMAPRAIVGFDPARLPPKVSWTRSGDTLSVTLRNRGGGLGPTALRVNGRELASDVRPPGLNPKAKEATFTVDLKPYARFMLGEARDVVVLQAFDAEERLSSRGGGSLPPGLLDEPETGSVDLFALVIGTHDYVDDGLDLSLPDDDARAVAQALEAGGRALIGDKGEVHVTLLSTESGQTAPGRQSIEAAFAKIAAQADPYDILIVYLAGHGVTQDGAYYYPFPEATREDLADQDLLAVRALSSDQLMELLRSVPASKQLLILDTCESGGALEGGRSQLTDYAQQRTLEELKQRMGLYILAGAPAGRSAYERAELGHGLLTYALLDGLRGGEHLKDGAYWDASALLNHTVDEVPVLAASLDLGDVQRPVLSTPGEARSFVFGQLPADVDAAIPLRSTKLPVLSGGQVIDVDQGYDDARLSEQLGRAMAAAQAAPGAAFRWSPQAGSDQTWRLGGSYTQSGGDVSLNLVLASPDGARSKAQITGAPAAAADCAALWSLAVLDHAAGAGAAPPATLKAKGCGGL